MTQQLTLSPRKVAWTLAGTLLVLLCAHLAALYATLGLGIEYAFGLIPLFNFDAEESLPTLYAAVLHLSCAAVTAAIGAGKRRAGERFGRHWMALGVIFCFLALDEMLMIHEKFSQLEAVIPAEGVLRYPWVVVYGPAALILGLLFIPFILALPRAVAGRFVLAGAIFVGGAVGMEMLGGVLLDSGEGWGYALAATVEELCEMVGLIVFLHAAMGYAARSGAFDGVLISIGAPADAGPAPLGRETALGRS